MTNQQTVTVYTYERIAEYDPQCDYYFCSLSADAPTDGEYEHDEGTRYQLPEGFFLIYEEEFPFIIDNRGCYCAVYWGSDGAVCVMGSSCIEYRLKAVMP